MNIFANYFKGVPKDNNILDNLKKDCIGNICSGLNTAFVANFVAIVARKYLHANGLQLSILMAAIYSIGLFSIFVSSACPINKESKCVAFLGTSVCIVGMFSLPFRHKFLGFRHILCANLYNRCLRPLI